MPRILTTPLRHIAALFEPAPTPAAPLRREWLVVFAILVLAAVVRFWELGSFSFHKPDEDTTALAAVHILEDGTPRFPSGMFYARAIVQSYLIGASFKLFGVSEWSARLPSALCGILIVWLAWLVSRRFLTFPWRIAMTLCVALLPVMILDSQETRMYGFMVASLLGATWQVFRWDETDRTRHLVYAVLWMLLAIQFHTLALLGAGVLMFPGLARGDPARFLRSAAALVATGIGYLLISRWQGSFYPELARDEYFPGWSDPLREGPEPVGHGLMLLLPGALLAAVVIALALLATRRMLTLRWPVFALLVVAAALQAAVQYHLAALCWIGAAVLALRHRADARWLFALLAGAAVVAVAHFLLIVSGGLPPRQALGAMTGWPSIWPALQVAQYSWAAAALVAIGLAIALLRLARARPVHEIWLYLALTAWAPLVVVGLNAWFVPPRYVEFALMPMLLTAFVVAAGLVSGRRALPAPARPWVAALPVAVLAINPPASWTAIVEGVRHADHRAAAQFLKSLPLRDDDILVAEEVIMQHYYLGRVDYWLASPQVAGQFVIRRDGRFVEQYTHSAFIDSIEALQRLDAHARAQGRRVFVIGSSEIHNNVYNRGRELDAHLRAGALPVIYQGADGAVIWKAGAP
jgi:hypothetical protein